MRNGGDRTPLCTGTTRLEEHYNDNETEEIRRETSHAGAALPAASLVAAPVSAFDIEDIGERGKRIAATSGSLPPLTFVDTNNVLDGYDIQVAGEGMTMLVATHEMGFAKRVPTRWCSWMKAGSSNRARPPTSSNGRATTAPDGSSTRSWYESRPVRLRDRKAIVTGAGTGSQLTADGGWLAR